MVWEKPRVWTTVGKKFLKPVIVRGLFCWGRKEKGGRGGGDIRRREHTVSSQMHMSHDGENPHHGILSRLAEARPHRRLAFISHRFHGHAVGRQLALVLREPPRVMREIREEEKPGNGNDKSDCALQDKQPFPAADAADVAEPVEDSRCNEAGECGCENVACVQDGDARGDLFALVEHGEQIHGSRVVRRFGDAEEEAGEEQAGEVFGERRERRDDGPERHADAHVARGPRAVQKHVAGDLAEKVAYKEDADACLVLRAAEIQVFFQVVETG